MHSKSVDLDQLQSSAIDAYQELTRRMRSRGFGKRIGFGNSPAIIVTDLIKGFTHPESPMGSSEFDTAVLNTRMILDVARPAGIPIFLVTSAYDQAKLEAGAWELKVDHDGLFHGSRWVEFDDRLGQVASDQIVVKRYPSPFFGTDLVSRLVSQHVDTVVLVGVSTSGCVRAAAIDGCCFGFRTMVVEEAVADRFELPHRANLFDIDMKYGDVVSLDETTRYLNTIALAGSFRKGTGS